MNTKLIFRARILLACICLSLPALAILSHLTSSKAIWMFAAILLWASLLGVTIGHLVALKRLERIVEALREKGLSEAELETLVNTRITLPCTDAYLLFNLPGMRGSRGIAEEHRPRNTRKEERRI